MKRLAILLAICVWLFASGCGANNDPATVHTAIPLAAGLFAELATRLRSRAADIRKLDAPVRIALIERPDEYRTLNPATGLLETSATPAISMLRVSRPALEGLARGRLEPHEALAQGEILLDGDMALLMQTLVLLGPETTVQPPESSAAQAPSRDEVAAARAALFERWGAVFPDGPTKRLMPSVSASMLGGPAWPVRESYALMQRGTHTVIATDGLSDPFPDDDGPPTGFGLEVWAETDQTLQSASTSWLMALVAEVGYQIAAETIRPAVLERFGLILFDIPISQLKFSGSWPPSVVTPDSQVAVLLVVAELDRQTSLEPPFEAIRYGNIRLLTVDQRAEVMAGGPAVARRLAQELGPVSRLPER